MPENHPRLGLVQFIESVKQELLEYQQGDAGTLELQNIEMEVSVAASMDTAGKVSICVVDATADSTNGQPQRVRLQFKVPTRAKPGESAGLGATMDVGVDSVAFGGPMYLNLDDVVSGNQLFELPESQQEALQKVWIIGGPAGSTEIDLSDSTELSKSLKEHIGLGNGPSYGTQK